ncbi:MAG: prolipoprotein diacylglyceryl transferase family protein [Thermoguttaceae bacterium]|jgi:phosphatidylglycerol:prolipoprotein diacylglycerol transferase
MWLTLFHIPLEIAGLPVFGMGLLLGLWAVFSVGLLAWLAWRQGFNADTWSYVPILLIVAAVIAWLLPTLCEEQGFPIHGYGIMMLLAVVSATALTLWRAKHIGLDPDLIYTLVLWMVIPGIIAGRLFYVVEYWSTQYRPVYSGWALAGAVLNIAQGGLVVYGAFLGGVLGLFIIAKKLRLPLLALADLFSPGMMLGLAIGRIGCLMTGCCYGGECHLPWAITFPPGSPVYESQIERGRMYGFSLSANPNAAPILLAVDPDSPAGRAGLKSGERLQKIDGQSVASAGMAYAYLRENFKNQEPLTIEASDGPAVVLSPAEIHRRSLPVHPTQIYSTIDAILICLLLLAAEPFLRRDGDIFALMISIYAVTRFLIEILRSDEAAVSGTGMSISQNISLALLILVVGLWFYILHRPKGKALSACRVETAK